MKFSFREQDLYGHDLANGSGPFTRLVWDSPLAKGIY